MKKLFFNITTYLLMLTIPCVSLMSMQPFKKNGRYYFSENHTSYPVSFTKALHFLQHKLSPKHIAETVSGWFTKDAKNNPITMLNPTTMVPEKESIEAKIVWIGHASFLIQINGFNILTDPIFGDIKYGPLTFSKRGMPAGVSLEDLPPIDVVVISHDHSDHLDTDAITELCKKYNPTILVPEGKKEEVETMGCKKVVENTWWQENSFTKNERTISLACLPANHWSLRFTPNSYRKSLCCGWMISSGDTNIYFAGDTASGEHFKQIAQRFPSIDMAFMPISPTEEHESCHTDVHVDAAGAIDAFIDLNAYCFVPMHYGTFLINKDHLDYPVQKLHSYWQTKSEELKNKKLLFARCGVQYLVK